jgi:hypothetical protein
MILTKQDVQWSTGLDQHLLVSFSNNLPMSHPCYESRFLGMTPAQMDPTSLSQKQRDEYHTDILIKK